MLKIAQIGAGRFGIHHVKLLTGPVTGVELKLICDASDASLEEAARLAPVARRTKRLEDVFNDAAIDAVVIATNSETHGELALRALKAGKHCFVEKPLAMSSSVAREAVDAAAARNRILAVGHLLRFHPAYEKLREIAASGELGRLCYFHSARLNLGTVRKSENALWSLAPHDILAMLDLAGRDPVSVTARGGAFLQKKIHDVVFFTLDFGDKLIGLGHVSWLDPLKMRRMIVVGDKMAAVVDDLEPADKLRIHEIEIEAGSPPRVKQGAVRGLPIPSADPLQLELTDFVRCATDGGKPRADGSDGLRVVRVLEAAQRSLEKGGAPMEIR